VLVMLLIVFITLVVAGAVLLYVAYPYRGETMPWHPEIGDALKRGVDAFPTLDSPPREKRPVVEGHRNPLAHFKRHTVSTQG
jgi:hypothetical protein